MPAPQEEHITDLLRLMSKGDSAAEARLLGLLYGELRRLAAGCLRGERSDHTLQPTALVNEAYLRLLGQRGKDWQNRGHFMAVAAQVMRRVLVDHARARNSQKRAGQAGKVSLEEGVIVANDCWADDFIDLDAALQKLATLDPRQAQIIELRFFAGMTEAEIADVLGVSERTVKRDWNTGRAWLYGELRKNPKGAARAASQGRLI